jgi:hypothetical protein
MSFARELAEAVEAPSIPEQITFLELLDEHLTTAVHTGFFTEEMMEAAMVLILRESGATEDDLDDVYQAIDEWVEEIDLIQERENWLSKPVPAPKKRILDHSKSGSSVSGLGPTSPSHSTVREKKTSKSSPVRKKTIGRMISDTLAHRVKDIQTKTKTGKMLKHAAAGAIKQIGKKPGSAKEILKKGAKKAGKKLLHHAIKKGLKMVFGKWAKVEHIEAISEARRSSKRAEVERAFAKRGTIKMPHINPQEYPQIHGMEGPFQFRDGRILYYDPREGRYYDRKSDMYLDRNDIPEDFREMLDALIEVG